MRDADDTRHMYTISACLATHSPLKCAVLQLLHSTNITNVGTTAAIATATTTIATTTTPIIIATTTAATTTATTTSAAAAITTTTPITTASTNSGGGATGLTKGGDEKYPALVDSFCQILRSNNNSAPHVQAQECILSIIQSFCDTEITLLQNSFVEEAVNSEYYLANALPAREHLLLFIATIVEHLMNDNVTFVTYLPVVRILLLLTEHDYGFYFVREHLNRKALSGGEESPPFGKLLNSIQKNFSSKEADDCLSTLNILTQFLKVCSTAEEVDGPMFIKSRTMKMSVEELRGLVGWKLTKNADGDDGSSEVQQHPLVVVEQLLKVGFFEIM